LHCEIGPDRAVQRRDVEFDRDDFNKINLKEARTPARPSSHYPGAGIRSVNLISFIFDGAVTRAELAHDAQPRRYRMKRMREMLRHINVY